MCAFWCFIAKSWSSMWCVANGINRSFCHFRLFFPALSFLSRKNWLELYDKSQFGRGNKNANLKHITMMIWFYCSVMSMFIDSTIKICPKCASHPTETTNIFWMTTALQNTHRRHIISSPPKLFFIFGGICWWCSRGHGHHYSIQRQNRSCH